MNITVGPQLTNIYLSLENKRFAISFRHWWWKGKKVYV